MNTVFCQSAQLPLMQVKSWCHMQRTEFDGSPCPASYPRAVTYCGRCCGHVWAGLSEPVVHHLNPDQEFSFATTSERRHSLFEALLFGVVNRLFSAKSAGLLRKDCMACRFGLMEMSILVSSHVLMFSSSHVPMFSFQTPSYNLLNTPRTIQFRSRRELFHINFRHIH
jgi:hypothetical protein